MKVLTGHLTQGNKDAIRAILAQGLMAGKVGRTNYQLSNDGSTFTVIISQRDRGMIPCGGSQLRTSHYTSTFKP